MAANLLSTTLSCAAPGCSRTTGLKTCSRCKLAKYCSQDCQNEDFGQHKKSCKKLKHWADEICRIEGEMHQHDASDEDSDSDGDGDIRKSLGSFPPNFNFLDMQNMYQNTKDLQEIRYCWAEEAFKVASKLKEKSILQRVYDEMIAALSMTTMDGIMVKSVIPIMELLLGREDDCYKFVVWHMTRDYSMPDWDRCKGKWREMEGLNKYEDVFEVVKRRPPPTPAMNKFVSQPMKPQGPDDLDLGMLLGLIGIKLLAINRYEEGAKAFAKKSSEEFAIGSLTKKVYKDQYRQLKKYLKRAQMLNDTILPALLNPQPLLHQPATHHVKFGDIFETKRLVDKTWLFFDLCPGAKVKIKQFVIESVGSNGLLYNPYIPPCTCNSGFDRRFTN